MLVQDSVGEHAVKSGGLGAPRLLLGCWEYSYSMPCLRKNDKKPPPRQKVPPNRSRLPQNLTLSPRRLRQESTRSYNTS